VRRLAIVLAALLAAAAAAGGNLRTLEHSQPAGEITGIVISAGIGDVEIRGEAGSEIRARVEIKEKSHGLFGSRLSDRDVQALEIEHSVSDGTLTLRVGPERKSDHNFSETWTVYVPAGFAATVRLGVGDLTVLDLTGSVKAEVGVGDVRIEGSNASFGHVHASCGVGDATLRTPDGHEEGEGFIGHSLTAHGPGQAELHAQVGVGDVTIRLR
jgi:hypothetical protein